MTLSMLLDAAVILPGDIYERTFVNWTNLSEYSANRRVGNTKVRSYITAMLNVYIDIDE